LVPGAHVCSGMRAGVTETAAHPSRRRAAAYTHLVDFLVALIPSIGVGILFFIVIRALVNADRNERAARKRLEEEDARKAARDEG
jgi:hypothetical protein